MVWVKSQGGEASSRVSFHCSLFGAINASIPSCSESFNSSLVWNSGRSCVLRLIKCCEHISDETPLLKMLHVGTALTPASEEWHALTERCKHNSEQNTSSRSKLCPVLFTYSTLISRISSLHSILSNQEIYLQVFQDGIQTLRIFTRPDQWCKLAPIVWK